MADSDALQRLQKLAQQADRVKVKAASPLPARKAANLSYVQPIKSGQTAARNAVLILAAALAVITWSLTNSVHDSLPSNSKQSHHWTDVTAHFHQHPHSAAASDPKAYTSSRGARQGEVGQQQPRQQALAKRQPQQTRERYFVAQAVRPAQLDSGEQPAKQEPQDLPEKQADSQALQQVTKGTDKDKMREQVKPPEDSVPRAEPPRAEAPRDGPRGPRPASRDEPQADPNKGGAPCSSGVECGHGACLEGRCACAVTYTGPECAEPVRLPYALQAEAGVMSNWSAAFEGEMVLNKRRMATRSSLTVHLPGKEDEPDRGYRELIGGGPELAQLNSMLPEDDTILKGSFFKSCAVVGSSGIVLNYEHGQDIDKHDMVFRFNSAPTKGYEKHVGSKTTHRITNTQNWGFHESREENILIHFRAKSAIKGLFWNQKQGKKKLPVYAFDPEFVEYMAFSLDFMATSGLYGIILAMQRCAKVDLYGFQVSTAHGVLYHYYDVCDVPANVDRDDSEYNVVKAFAKAGLVSFQEPCVMECHGTPEECEECKNGVGFELKPMPSDAKCAPGRVSRGHLEVPWRRDRGKHHGHGM